MLNLDWGNLPTLLIAILTTGSVLLTRRTLKQGNYERLRDQAKKVHVSKNETNDGVHEVMVENLSEAAIYGLILIDPRLDYDETGMTDLITVTTILRQVKPTQAPRVQVGISGQQRLNFETRMDIRGDEIPLGA